MEKSSESTTTVTADAAVGTYIPATPNDKRSPCPMINALANHGYLPRNGQNVTSTEMKEAMSIAGLSTTLGTFFVNTVYNVHQPRDQKTEAGLLSRIWSTVRDPWTLLASLGTRRPGQVDRIGRPILDLDQLALHNAIEHDVSLTRRDFAQPAGNCARQADLVEEVLASSTDQHILTMQALAGVRRQRIATQRSETSGLEYGALQHELGCGEIALILGVFGDGKTVPYDYVAAFLREERLPLDEGWQKRTWWTLGLVEVKLIANRVKRMVGVEV